jgi:hypothetical protein
VVVDALAFGQVPFKESDQGAATAQVRGQFRAGDSHRGFDDGIRVVSDHNFAILPGDPVQIGDRALHVEPAAVRSNGLSNDSAPVVDTGEADWQEPGPCW